MQLHGMKRVMHFVTPNTDYVHANNQTNIKQQFAYLQTIQAHPHTLTHTHRLTDSHYAHIIVCSQSQQLQLGTFMHIQKSKICRASEYRPQACIELTCNADV